jgi:hypothetical protein
MFLHKQLQGVLERCRAFVRTRAGTAGSESFCSSSPGQRFLPLGAPTEGSCRGNHRSRRDRPLQVMTDLREAIPTWLRARYRTAPDKQAEAGVPPKRASRNPERNGVRNAGKPKANPRARSGYRLGRPGHAQPQTSEGDMTTASPVQAYSEPLYVRPAQDQRASRVRSNEHRRGQRCEKRSHRLDVQAPNYRNRRKSAWRPTKEWEKAQSGELVVHMVWICSRPVLNIFFHRVQSLSLRTGRHVMTRETAVRGHIQAVDGQLRNRPCGF